MLYTLVSVDDDMHPSMVEGRKNFVASTFPQVVDFCSLDKNLSGGHYRPTSPDDYDYFDWKAMMFTDLNFLKKIQQQYKNAKILGVIKEPNAQQLAAVNTEYLLGFDILDKLNDYSLLTNCGGFPDLFKNSELNVYALLDDLERSIRIRNTLRLDYPDDYHCNACEVWAIFKVI